MIVEIAGDNLYFNHLAYRADNDRTVRGSEGKLTLIFNGFIL